MQQSPLTIVLVRAQDCVQPHARGTVKVSAKEVALAIVPMVAKLHVQRHVSNNVPMVVAMVAKEVAINYVLTIVSPVVRSNVLRSVEARV